jgi:hypothetical protein
MNRLMGIVPLGLFAAYAAVAVERGRPAEALWMCHIANLLMAIGVFARSPRRGGTTWVSVASHLGGLAFGIYAVSRQRLSSNPWFAALVAFIVLQQACRWWTPEALNVNLAHAEYRTWEGAFGGYWAYWLATTLAAAACLWTIGRLSTRGRKA